MEYVENGNMFVNVVTPSLTDEERVFKVEIKGAYFSSNKDITRVHNEVAGEHFAKART